jgi:hypothetical protein
LEIVFAIPGFSLDAQSREGQMVRKAIRQCASKVGKATLRPGAVVFRIDGAFNPRSSDLQNAAALAALLVCLYQLDAIWLLFHPFALPLYHAGVVYKRTEVWDTIPALYGRRYGDCKSLTAARVAELRRQGVWCRPVFRFKELSGGTMYHILVMFADGSWEDPSKLLGMQVAQEWELMPHAGQRVPAPSGPASLSRAFG